MLEGSGLKLANKKHKAQECLNSTTLSLGIQSGQTVVVLLYSAVQVRALMNYKIRVLDHLQSAGTQMYVLDSRNVP